MTRPNQNLRTRLKRRARAGDPMAVYDTLPAPLRQWLQSAALPWSPQSARRVWQRALAREGCPEAALKRCSQIEMALLGRDRLERGST
jgi:hypothetical protein